MSPPGSMPSHPMPFPPYLDHRPRSRQVTGARCTEVAALSLPAEYPRRAYSAGSERAARVSRSTGNVSNGLKNICKFWSLIKTRHFLVCNIINMMLYNGCSQILHISLKTEKYFIAHPWRLLSVVGLELMTGEPRPRYSALQLLGETQWILTGPARVEWLWVNAFNYNEYHIWQAWPSTCGEQVTKIWSTSLHCADANIRHMDVCHRLHFYKMPPFELASYDITSSTFY